MLLSVTLFCYLQSCIQVALDFVSPENVQECIKLTEEFRLLVNEDKLEVCPANILCNPFCIESPLFV